MYFIMSKKTKVIQIALFCIFVLFAVATFAFLITETTTNNIITFGKLKMKVVETTMEDGIEKEIENGSNINITGDSNVNRIIKIQNTGTHEMYVRVLFNIEGIKNNVEFDTSSLVSTNEEGKYWEYKDGWYYYNKTLKANEITNNLTINMIFDIDKISSTYSGSNFNLFINAEALQYENNSKSVFEAKGWPTK